MVSPKGAGDANDMLLRPQYGTTWMHMLRESTNKFGRESNRLHDAIMLEKTHTQKHPTTSSLVPKRFAFSSSKTTAFGGS